MKQTILSWLLYLIPYTSLAAPAFLVESDWLSEHIEDENLVILEVRYHPHR